jgi:hypothetical protein
MKLESLKSSKFEAFKANEINNPLSIIGGWINTHWSSTSSSGATASGTDTQYFLIDDGGCPSGAVITASGHDYVYSVVDNPPGGTTIGGPIGFTNIGNSGVNLDNTVNK